MRHTLALLFAATLPAQASIKLAVLADATTNADQPMTNYGTSPELSFGKDFTNGPPFRTWFTRGHVLFDVTSITRPAPARAQLWWYQTRSIAAGCLNVATHRLTQPWVESTVTWTTNPTFDSTVISRTCVGDSFNLGWKTFDITTLVKGFLTNQHPNLGILIRDDGEVAAGAARPGYGSSKEGTDPLRWPYVQLDWAAPYGTGCGPTVPALAVKSGEPALGTVFTLEVSGVPAGAPVILFVGASDKTWLGVPLPYTLLISQPNCIVFASGEAVLNATSTAAGTAPFALPIPNNIALRGVPIFHQAASIDAQLQLYLTNAIAEVLY